MKIFCNSFDLIKIYKCLLINEISTWAQGERGAQRLRHYFIRNPNCKVEEYKICEKLTQTWRARTICLARSRGVRGHSGAAFGRSLHLFAHSSALSERYMPGAKQRYALAHSGYARTKLSCVQSNIFVRTQLCFVPRK